MKEKGKFGHGKSKGNDHSRKPTAATLIMREDIQEMTTTDQIVLIEQLAEKITSNAGENVGRRG